MTTTAVRAFYSEDGNYLDILFNGVIDISAGATFTGISLYNGSVTATLTSGASFVTTADSKYVRILVDSTFAITVEAWSNAEKQVAVLVMSAGALTDIDSAATGAVVSGDGIRGHFTKESSLSTTFGNYHAAGETVYLPHNVNMTQDITALDQPLSTGIVKFEGYDASTVITGDITVGDASLSCTAADPLVLQLERLSFFGDIVFNETNSQYLGGKFKNVIWKGNFRRVIGAFTRYYYGGLAINNSAYLFTLENCNWSLQQAHIPAENAEETGWNVINCNITGLSTSTAYLFAPISSADPTKQMEAVFSYCNFSGKPWAFYGVNYYTYSYPTYNCAFSQLAGNPLDIPSSTYGIQIINDTTNASGLTGLSLADSQGYGYISGGSINAGRAFTQLDGDDSPGERAVGVPRGSMVGVGAFAAIPAKVITPTSASVSGAIVTYTLPAGSFDSGDSVRAVLNNVEDTAGNVIERDTILSATAS